MVICKSEKQSLHAKTVRMEVATRSVYEPATEPNNYR